MERERGMVIRRINEKNQKGIQRTGVKKIQA
jgi:hypothetical protein